MVSAMTLIDTMQTFKYLGQIMIREGVDAVAFGTCLYVGTAAFIRKFQSSSFILSESKVRFY